MDDNLSSRDQGEHKEQKSRLASSTSNSISAFHHIILSSSTPVPSTPPLIQPYFLPSFLPSFHLSFLSTTRTTATFATTTLLSLRLFSPLLRQDIFRVRGAVFLGRRGEVLGCLCNGARFLWYLDPVVFGHFVGFSLGGELKQRL